MIITKVDEPHTKKSKKQKGKLEPKNNVIMQSYTLSQTIIHTSPPACYDLPNNTLRLNMTHSDTYNLVGFSGCLHLWWIPLVTSELSVTMFQSPTHKVSH